MREELQKQRIVLDAGNIMRLVDGRRLEGDDTVVEFEGSPDKLLFTLMNRPSGDMP